MTERTAEHVPVTGSALDTRMDAERCIKHGEGPLSDAARPHQRVAFFHSVRRRETRHDVGTRIPRHRYWGAYELSNDGRTLTEVFPGKRKHASVVLDWLFDRGARRKRNDVDGAVDVRIVVSKPELWKLVLDATVRTHTSPLVWIFAGYPLPWSKRGLRRLLDEVTMRLAMRYCAAICPLTSRETEALRSTYGTDTPFYFIPYGIDVDFYAPADATRIWDVLVVGDNRNRDWETVLQAVRRAPDVSFLLASRAYAFDHRFALPNAELRTGEDVASMRALLERSSLVWVATSPNTHFSGMTTVLMGMAAGKLVILDDPEHLTDYFLRPDENCVLVDRGDPDAAVDRIRALRENPEAMQPIGAAALTSAHHNSTMRSAEALADLLSRAATGRDRG